MTRFLGRICRWTGARLVCLGTHLHVIGCGLAPRTEPGAWTQAHVPGQTAPAPKGWN